MSKLYRECRQGKLPLEDGSRLVNMLAQLRAGLEASALEARVAALEARR